MMVTRRAAQDMNHMKLACDRFARRCCSQRGHAAAQEGGKAISKTTISLGTATPGGGFPLYGNAFAEVMNAADPSLAIAPRNTKGSNENIPLLEAGRARYRAGRGRAVL